MPNYLRWTRLPTLTHSFIFFLGMGFFLSSCNVWSGLDSPSGDEQLLSAARGCFDRGDFGCATEYYQQLSQSSSDIKISETIFLNLAKDGFLSISDLVASLGSGRGGGNSIVNLANTLAERGMTTGNQRTNIQAYYSLTSSISNLNLRGYTRFIIAVTLLSQTLASVVGADGRLTASDLSQSASCGTTSSGGCAAAPGCGIGSSLLGHYTTDAQVTSITNSAGWSQSPSLKKVVEASKGVNDGLQDMGILSADGIFKTIALLSNFPGSDACMRRLLSNTLFYSN